MSKFIDLVPRVLKGFKFVKLSHIYPFFRLEHNFTDQGVKQIYYRLAKKNCSRMLSKSN